EHVLKFIGNQDDILKANETLWEQQPSGKFIIKSYKAIVGSMSLLNSLYNNNKYYCTKPEGFTYSGNSFYDLLEQKDQDHLTNISSSLRIQPYDLKTGDVLPCTYPLIAIPSNFKTNRPAAFDKGM